MRNERLTTTHTVKKFQMHFGSSSTFLPLDNHSSLLKCILCSIFRVQCHIFLFIRWKCVTAYYRTVFYVSFHSFSISNFAAYKYNTKTIYSMESVANINANLASYFVWQKKKANHPCEIWTQTTYDYCDY